MPQYMLILHDVSTDDAEPGVGRSNAQRHVDWIEHLKHRGLYVTAFMLSANGGRHVMPERGRPTTGDGASAATKEAIAGVVVVDVADRTAAEWVARESPHLHGRNFIEIRAVDRDTGNAQPREDTQVNSPSVPIASGAGEPQPRRPRIRAALLVLIVALAAGLAGLFATDAFSRGFGFGPWHGGGYMAPLDPAAIEDRADRMVRHLAIEIDASAEQQEMLRAVVKGAVKDLVPMREKTQAARRQARDLLTQSSINRSEIERFRAEQIALADAASRRLAQAIADAAEVLTPEQRRKINERFPPDGGYWHRWRRG
jgi:protein CpxP